MSVVINELGDFGKHISHIHFSNFHFFQSRFLAINFKAEVQMFTICFLLTTKWALVVARATQTKRCDGNFGDQT